MLTQNNPAPGNQPAENMFTADHASSVIEDVDAILKEIKGLTGHGAVIGAMLQSVRDRAQTVVDAAKAATNTK